VRPGCGISTTPARPQPFGVTAHTAAYGHALRGRDQERTQRSSDTTPSERELKFRLSYLLLYEGEIRSAERRVPDSQGPPGR
jgi:hypothetical protein